MKDIKTLSRNRKGIDTILAALLMVVIVVVASVMVYAWSTGLLGGLLITPPTGKEAINIENSAFANNGTSVTLYLRNTGTAAITLSTYYVKDSTGAQYSRTTWAGPTIQPNGLGNAYINIGASCPAPTCTQASNGFTFAPGSAYTILVITSRNGQFTFTVTR